MKKERTLWMGDIELWMNEKFIMEAFSSFGIEPKSIELIIDKRINKFKNFSYIEFNNINEANIALFKLNGKKIPNANSFFKLNLFTNNDHLYVVFIGNLSYKVNDKELFNFLKSYYPSIISVSIISDNGRSRGYGFAHFSEKEDYKKCLNEMDGKLFYNRNLQIRQKSNNNEKRNNKNNNNLNSIPLLANNYNKKIGNQNKIINCFETNIQRQDKKEIDTKKAKFNSINIELLKLNNINILYKYIQESLDKLIIYCKNKNIRNIPNAFSYYCSYNT